MRFIQQTMNPQDMRMNKSTGNPRLPAQCAESRRVRPYSRKHLEREKTAIRRVPSLPYDRSAAGAKAVQEFVPSMPRFKCSRGLLLDPFVTHHQSGMWVQSRSSGLLTSPLLYRFSISMDYDVISGWVIRILACNFVVREKSALLTSMRRQALACGKLQAPKALPV